MSRFVIRSNVGTTFRGRACARSSRFIYFDMVRMHPGKERTVNADFLRKYRKAAVSYMKRGVLSVFNEAGKPLTVQDIERLSSAPVEEAKPKVKKEPPKAVVDVEPEPEVEPEEDVPGPPSIDDLTVKKIKRLLTERGVDYKDAKKKADLYDLLVESWDAEPTMAPDDSEGSSPDGEG